jgi:predicted nucleotidyltransferase
MSTKSINIPHLASEIKNQFPEIKFAYIFGSASNGEVNKGSDIDIAIWVDDSTNLLELIPQITGLVEKNTRVTPCDLTILNRSNCILSYEVLQGSLLFVRDEAMETYLDFYTKTCREYEDTLFYMKKQLHYRGHEVQWCY